MLSTLTRPTLLNVFLSGYGGNGLQLGWNALGDVNQKVVLSTKVLYKTVVSGLAEVSTSAHHYVIVYADFCRVLAEQVGRF